MRLISVVIYLGLALGRLQAEDSLSNSAPVVVSIQREQEQSDNPRFSCYITVGGNKFSFLVPRGLRVSNEGARIKLLNHDDNCVISINLRNFVPTEANPLSPDTCRDWLLSRYPGAKILETFSDQAANESGPAFDLQWKADSFTQCTRAVFVPSAAGLFEFNTTGSVANFRALKATLRSVMMTFRASKDGKLNTVHPLGIS